MALSTVGEDLSFITVSTHDIPTSNLAYHILLLEDGDRYMTANTIDLHTTSFILLVWRWVSMAERRWSTTGRGGGSGGWGKARAREAREQLVDGAGGLAEGGGER